MSIDITIVFKTDIMEPTQIKMKIGWLFWITPSVTWNAFINSLSSSFDKPGITIIAYVRINPVAKAHNNIEKNNDMSKKSTLYFTL